MEVISSLLDLRCRRYRILSVFFFGSKLIKIQNSKFNSGYQIQSKQGVPFSFLEFIQYITVC
jgi:hypothetical protein